MIQAVEVAYVGPRDETFPGIQNALHTLGRTLGLTFVHQDVPSRTCCVHWAFEAGSLDETELAKVRTSVMQLSNLFRRGDKCPGCHSLEPDDEAGVD